jgi:hypothetical protein
VNCLISVRDARARSPEPSIQYKLAVTEKDDIERGLRSAIRLWEQEHPQQALLDESFTILIEVNRR